MFSLIRFNGYSHWEYMNSREAIYRNSHIMCICRCRMALEKLFMLCKVVYVYAVCARFCLLQLISGNSDFKANKHRNKFFYLWYTEMDEEINSFDYFLRYLLSISDSYKYKDRNDFKLLHCESPSSHIETSFTPFKRRSIFML